MQKIINFLKQLFTKEEESTKKITEIINSFVYSGTNNEKGTVNIFTLLWRLIDSDENYNILKKCNTPAKLRDTLRGNTIRLSSCVTLNTQNYINLKTDLNKFYKWFRKVAEYYKANSMNLNRDEVIKALIDKSPNIINLLSRNKNKFTLRLSRIVFLPKIKGDQGGYAIERPHYRNGDHKLIDNFVKFVIENRSEKEVLIDHLKNKSSEYLSFFKRKKITLAMFIFASLLTTGIFTYSFSSKNFFANIFSETEKTQIIEQPKQNLNQEPLKDVKIIVDEKQEKCLENEALIIEGFCKKTSEIKFSADKNTQIKSSNILQVVQLGRDEKIGNYIILRYKSENAWKKVFLGNISFDNNSTNLINLKRFNKNVIISDNLQDYFLFKEFDINENDSDILKQIISILKVELEI